jgi:hypothetical protein
MFFELSYCHATLKAKKKFTFKMSVKSVCYFIGSRTMNSFNLIQALMSLAFLITFCLYIRACNNYDACKYV